MTFTGVGHFCHCTFFSEKPVPDMTYNVFGGTLSPTQSINQSTVTPNPISNPNADDNSELLSTAF